MSVKRYEWVACDEHSCHCDVVESADGDMVDYEDYAALEKKLAESRREFRAADATIENLQMQNEKLAAENSGLKEACGGDGSYRDCPACAHSEYIEAPESPATDAFLAEVRAQGVDVAIEHLINKFEGTGRIGVPVIALEWLAKELRKGVQP